MTVRLDRGEKAITLPEAAIIANVRRETVWGWITRGVEGVRLRAGRIGRQWFTCREALVEFQDRLTPKWQTIPPEEREPVRRRRRRDPDRERRIAAWRKALEEAKRSK